MEAGERQFPGDRIRRKNAEIGDNSRGTFAGKPQTLAAVAAFHVAAGGDKIQFLYKGALVVSESNQHLLGGRRDLGRASSAGQAGGRLAVIADHRSVDVGEAID